MGKSGGRVGFFVASLALVALTALPAAAAVVQDFESGLGSGFTLGDAQRIGVYGVAPAGGQFQLLLTTFGLSEGGGLSGANAIPVTGNGVNNLTSYLGLASGTISFAGAVPVTEGSAYQLPLGSLGSGAVVGFSYDFLTSDNLAPDFAFAALQNTATLQVTYVVFANSLQTSPSLGVSPAPAFNVETGWQTLAGIVVPGAGNYTLSIGVVDARNNQNQSGLLLDNITVSAVPEPPMLALSLIGAAVLSGLVGRRRRQ